MGESAKMTKVKNRGGYVTDHGNDSDYTHSEHDNNYDSEHEEQASERTDISTAQLNIAEQAEITERKEIEEMKGKLQGDDATQTVLRFILERLMMMQISLKEIKLEQSNLAQKIEKLEKNEVKTRRTTNYCMTELQEVATNNFKLLQSTIKHDQDISSLKKQMQSCETKIQKGYMTISGIVKTEDEDVKSKIVEFLRDTIKIGRNMEIKTAYRMNKYKVAFQLQDPNNIGVIFKNASNLKGVKNANQKYYRIEEMLPDHQYEDKQRRRDIKKENSRMPFTHQAMITTEKNKMFTGDGEDKKEWRAPVQPTPVKDFLLMSKSEEEMLEALQIVEGPTKSKDGSKFVSYAARVASIDLMKLMNRRLKNDNMMATHIIGAYRIFGKDHYNLQSFCDDGEHGGGRRMLNILKEEGLFNIAVFIVRYKDGENIGKARFEIITELTKMVLSKFSHHDRGERRDEEEKLTADALRKAVTWNRKGPNKNNE